MIIKYLALKFICELKKIIFTLQPKIESNRFSGFPKMFKTKNIMEQLHYILNQYPGLQGQEPKRCVCLIDSEFMDKRCLYTWVS